MSNGRILKKGISMVLSLVVGLGSLFAFSVAPITATAATMQATYYVSPTGSDSNPGTIDSPFQSLAKAQSAVRGINSNMTGDIYVYLRGGTYNIPSTINFTKQDSGTNGHTIYYEAYPNETPVLNGATKVTGWTQYSGNIYQATLNRSTKLRNLYVNDQRASMTSKNVSAQGSYGTYSINAGQASWAWKSGTAFDGVKYNASDIPNISNNQDDLEIVNGSTWNENIACVRAVITSGNYKVLELQQPYGAIAQTPCSGAGFVASGNQTVYNAFEFMNQNSAGQFYFNKTTHTLYYCIRPGENMSTADVEAPNVTTLINIAGTSTTNRVNNITFQGITFENTDWQLENIDNSYGKATTQAATAYIAYCAGDFHSTDYDLLDTLPGMIQVSSANSINFTGDTIKHSGSDGITEVNDVVNSSITGCYFNDITSSGITVGHPQDIYLNQGGTHEKYPSGVKGICTNDSITNNLLYNLSMAPGFGGCAGITAFFVASLDIEHNQIQQTGYNGINLGWGWCNFNDSTTCHDNNVSYNRLISTMSRLHDSGAIYTLGQMPGTTINSNYVQGIPPAGAGPTYGLHNDEGSAYITENDNVLNIDPGVKYTINCENYNGKHDLTIRRTYATVCKMGANPPNSTIDLPVAVPDNVWPITQYNTVLNSGIQEAYRNIIPSSLLATPDYVYPASCATTSNATISIRSSGDPSNTIWFAPSGTSTFTAGPTMTEAGGTATSISAPSTAGSYYLYVLNSSGTIIGKSSSLLRIAASGTTQMEAENYSAQSGGLQTETCSEGGQDVGYISNGSYAVYNSINFNNSPNTFQARVASGTNGGNIQVRLDSPTGTLLGTCAVNSTGGWQTWATVSCSLNSSSGTHNLYLVFTGGTGYLFNVNWFGFSGSSGIVSGNMYSLTNVMSGLCLDNYNTTATGTQAGQWTSNGNSTQQWTITSVGNGYFTLTNKMSNMNLDNNNVTTVNAHVVQWTQNGGNTQLWKIVNVSGSIYTLQNEMSGLNLDNGSSSSNGQTIVQNTPNGTSTQQWVIQ